MTAYYNEIDTYVATWLENLIAEGLLPAGDVDRRSIVDVEPSDLIGYGQCHFFAGIGGWPYALRLAGWPDHEPVWTGSCPCQPLSSAGQRKGHADERHLWPAFYRLIAKCKPATVFGEQVASKDGREWLAGVRADLEHLGYAVGAADLPAAGVGAPHIRQRLWWVADTNEPRCKGSDVLQQRRPSIAWDGADGGLADAAGTERQQESIRQQERRNLQDDSGCSPTDGLGNTDDAGPQGRSVRPDQCSDQRPPWASGVLIPCADGKARRIKPSIQPLAHGVPARVGKLRAAGNAIVPQLAAEFIKASIEAMREAA